MKYTLFTTVFVTVLCAACETPVLEVTGATSIEGGKSSEFVATIPGIDADDIKWKWEVDPELFVDEKDKNVLHVSPAKIDNCDLASYAAKVTAKIGTRDISKTFTIRVGRKVCIFDHYRFEVGFFPDSDYLPSMAVTNNGNIWVVSRGVLKRGNGIFEVKNIEKSGTATHKVIHHSKKSKSLSDDNITRIQAVNNDIWYSTDKSIGKLGASTSIDFSAIKPFDTRDIVNFYFDSALRTLILVPNDSAGPAKTYFAEVNVDGTQLVGQLHETAAPLGSGENAIAKIGEHWWLSGKETSAVTILGNLKGLPEKVTKFSELNIPVESGSLNNPATVFFSQGVGDYRFMVLKWGVSPGVYYSVGRIQSNNFADTKFVNIKGVSFDDADIGGASITGLVQTDKKLWFSSAKGLFSLDVKANSFAPSDFTYFHSGKDSSILLEYDDARGLAFDRHYDRLWLRGPQGLQAVWLDLVSE